MKLNLHVIWDELRNWGGELICSQNIDSHLTGVRFLDAADGTFSEGYLYLARAETLAHIPADFGPLNLVCMGVTDQSTWEQRGWSGILLPNTAKGPLVFRRLQEIFEKYAQWEQDLLMAIARNESLQAIFDCGARFLRNPIALFDSSLVFIMKTGALPAHIENTIWEEVLSKGYTRMENLPTEEQRSMAQLIATSKQPFFYRSPGKYSDHQQIVASLLLDGVCFGTFGMIDILEPFTLGQLSIVFHLKNLMELAFKNNAQFAHTLEDGNFFIERLLQGFSVDRNVVNYHIAKNHWRTEDEFCLLYFTGKDDSAISGNMHKMYAFRIRSLLGNAIVFPYENGILAINHKNDRVRTDSGFINELSQLLENLGLSCGASLVFQDFMNLKYAYIQCKTALASAQNSSEPAIYRFETHYIDHVMKALDVSTSVKSLCHPRILQLSNAEGGKGREYVHTLRNFLINGRNITATANRLFIHRNTLLYRLRRIEEILGFNLENADEQMLLMLYLSCLITDS